MIFVPRKAHVMNSNGFPSIDRQIATDLCGQEYLVEWPTKIVLIGHVDDLGSLLDYRVHTYLVYRLEYAHLGTLREVLSKILNLIVACDRSEIHPYIAPNSSKLAHRTR